MEIITRIGKIIEKYMAIIILAVATFALFIPKGFTWIELSWINYLLMLVMFGMGLTLKLDDFKVLFTNPKNVIVGCIAQYLIMPTLAFVLSKLFGLDNALLVGVILIGACPGGTASNVITYLSKGDVALSVGMTAINTLLAPVVTPFIVYMFLNTVVEIDILKMFIAIVNVVIAPIILGVIINKFFGKNVEKSITILPTVSIIAISMIVAAVVSNNASKILNTGFIIFLVVILHNLLGYVFGLLVGLLFKMENKQLKAISVEIGMQNSGLATSLAATAFAALPLAALPGAIFSVWHNISGAIIANIYSRMK